MSIFFPEDLVTLKADSHITAIVEHTWSQVDLDASDCLVNCYIHKNLPSKVRRSWFKQENLLPGHVIIAFLQPYDGCCLIPERSLELVDRSLAAGDVVKRSASDAQSGRVISTSLECSLQPICTEEAYNARRHPSAQGHHPSHGPRAPKLEDQRNSLLHGFPKEGQANRSQSISQLDSFQNQDLKVHANELTHWARFREADFVAYKGWVGQVREVDDEVTIRLTNGSVVTVEKPEELEEPYFLPGSQSYYLAQRLDRAGFFKYRPSGIGKPQGYPSESFYPGQHVETKKGNLRRGRWKFGSYNPNILPRGIVVDARCIELTVSWMFAQHRDRSMLGEAVAPNEVLNTDELESGEVVVYDRSKPPTISMIEQLPNASYGPDTGFGHRVRFRDPTGAAIKYWVSSVDDELASTFNSHNDFKRPNFRRIPRRATQGFDMNVLQVVSTSTKALVRWQDCKISQEDAVNLFPYLNTDENDVWPGERVSFKPVERKTISGSTEVRKLGVVQSVDAVGRVAKVRWYDHCRAEINEKEGAQLFPAGAGLWHGDIGDEISEVPLYDLAAYPDINFAIGDGALILPDELVTSFRASASTSLAEGGIGQLMRLYGSVPPQTSDPTLSLSHNEVESNSLHRQIEIESNPGDINWCGEIIDTCLDGHVIVRLGAATDARDILVQPERVQVIGLEDQSGDSGNSESEAREDGSVLMEDNSAAGESMDQSWDQEYEEAIDVSVEYDGNEPTDAEDEEMWVTDDEADAGNSSLELDQRDGAVQPDSGLQFKAISATTNDDGSVLFSKFPLMPDQFDVLSDHPTGHHYTKNPQNLTRSVLNRIMREHKIMRGSLPDGVFVRTWESRLDLLRVLIVGPQGTPYEFAPFVIDFQFTNSFPSQPPGAFFHSWTGNLGRINPNLYEDGKICLSLLGTWDAGERNEAWSDKSTILQILVSLMGLVLVREPYYNEAGYDVLIGSEESRVPSRLYSEKVFVLAKIFIKTALLKFPQGLEDVIRWLYLPLSEGGPHLLRRVLDDAHALLPDTGTKDAGAGVDKPLQSKNAKTSVTAANLSTGALILLRRHLEDLERLDLETRSQ